MSHIYIYSPSGAVINKPAFKRGIRTLETLGHQVELDEAVLARDTRFAGDDATRLAAIHRAASSGADVALISRGGYGLSRLLPAVPYKAIAKSIERGTQWVGLSDFPALQLALLAQTGAHSWAGPALGEDFGHAWDAGAEADDIMLACFDDLLRGQGEGAGWRMPSEGKRKPSATKSIATYASNTVATGQFDAYESKPGVLWGGNLSMLASLVGTPYLPAVKNGLLFIEDVSEHPYRIERMLTQLLHAGVLARQQAVIFGQFTSYQLAPQVDKGYKLQSVVDWLRTQIKAPVLCGLPFGHVPTKVLLPCGMKTRLSVQGRDALLYWG